MDMVADFMGAAADCQHCGKQHKVDVEQVLYGRDAVAELMQALITHAGWRRVAVVADGRTWGAAGADVSACANAAGLTYELLMVPDRARDVDPVCDEETRDELQARLGTVDGVLAVGSGVVNDLAKWMAWGAGLPYAVVATAASMNGYASANVATLVQGVKGLARAREAIMIASTPALLAEAPARLTAAGLGDVVAKTVSTTDWQVNHVLFGEYYCPYCAGLVARVEPFYRDYPEGIQRREEGALEALFAALILTGFSMTMAGTSSPASGGEHLISHTLDMMASRDGIEHDLHGRQVGVATIFCAALYERLWQDDMQAFAEEKMGAGGDGFWGPLGEAIAPYRDAKKTRVEEVQRRLREQPTLWQDVRGQLAEPPMPAQQLKSILQRGGAAHRLADIGVPRERFLAAVEHAGEIRERFSVLDLARCLGLLRRSAGEIVDQWLM